MHYVHMHIIVGMATEQACPLLPLACSGLESFQVANGYRSPLRPPYRPNAPEMLGNALANGKFCKWEFSAVRCCMQNSKQRIRIVTSFIKKLALE